MTRDLEATLAEIPALFEFALDLALDVLGHKQLLINSLAGNSLVVQTPPVGLLRLLTPHLVPFALQAN